MLKKVLITGASGLLGRAIVNEFKKDNNWKVLGLAFERCTDDLHKLDLCDFEAVQNVISKFLPDVIIHAAAERRPDIVDNDFDRAKRLNVDASKNLAHVASNCGSFLLYISTDYVFNGSNPPYKPGDVPTPINKYGQLKCEGEQAVIKTYPEKSAVLRVPLLYGDVEYLEESAVTVLLKPILNTSKPAEMSDYEKRYPTMTNDVAFVIRQIADRTLEHSNFKGIWHWSGEEQMTKYQMALCICEAFNLDSNHIVAVKTASAGVKRPYNSHLDCSALTSLSFGQQTSFINGIKVLSKFIEKNV